MLSKHFDFQEEEKKIYQAQEKNGAFKAGAGPNDQDKSFSIMIPPPNVTGSLHMGHALNNTLQDIVVRRKRMQGYDVLWQVGSDHAGIATQSLVEKSLAKDNIKRTDLTRDAFIKKVWAWKEESGGTIMQQLRRLGASCDFSRERFTMDQGLSEAVRHVFISLYRQGLIYKDKRLVNWDCHLKTAISDLEVVPKETKGKLYYIRYELSEKQYLEDSLVIATTRPETMFGDVAIAVHPDDERYKQFIGKHAVLPVSGRFLPIIADEYVDPETGTGAVKITPAHDFNDFEIGKRHKLPQINILNPDGTLNDNCSKDYIGVDRLEARKVLVNELKARDILVEIKEHDHKVPHGDRSGSIVEPYLTDQWYVDAPKLAGKAIEMVQSEEVRFVPANWDKTYYHWMHNIEPWCISRQLWWGHQIPAYYGPDGQIFVAEDSEVAHQEAEKYYGNPTTLRRDPDVLDTWFSSALWPFSTLGWPEETPDLKKYYPTDLLVTGFDIIFFWVARMMMMAGHFTQKAPFKDVYIHALVRDEKGQKMSKSKGNVIDPIHLIDQYGADAVRFTLTAMAVQGRDIKLSTPRIEGYRNFGTKLWNASRFAQMNHCIYDPEFNPNTAQIPLSHWILSKLQNVLNRYDAALDSYRFNDAAHILYHFIWGDVCDRYVEMIKPILSHEALPEQQKEIRLVTAYILRHLYIMLHPIMPFMTEALAEKTTSLELPALIHTKWPDLSDLSFNQKNIEMIDLVDRIINEIRAMRGALNIPASKHLTLFVTHFSDEEEQAIKINQNILMKMTRLDHITFDQAYQSEKSVSLSVGTLTMVSPLGNIIDLEQERKRLSTEKEKREKEINALEKRLSNTKFLENANDDVIQESKARLEENKKEYSQITQILGIG